MEINLGILKPLFYVCLVLAGSSVAVRADDDDNAGDLIPFILEKPTDGVSASEAFGSIVGSKAKYSYDIMQARMAYWNAYPNGKNVNELGKTYAEMLRDKDYYYFFVKSMDTWLDDGWSKQKFGRGRLEMMDAFSLPIDEGIQPEVQKEFDAWVQATLNTAKQGNGVFDGEQMQKGLDMSMDAYKVYVRRRNIEEYLKYSPSHPITSTDPRIYFGFLYLRANLAHSLKEVNDDYDNITRVLGKETVDAAIEKVRLMPKQADGFHIDHHNEVATDDYPINVLDFWVPDNADDRKYALRWMGIYTAKSITMGHIDYWIAAQKAFERLIKQFGEAKVMDAIREVRKLADTRLQMDKKRGYHFLLPDSQAVIQNRLRELLPLQVSVAVGQVQLVCSFARIGGKPWTQICEGTNGALVGVRVDDNMNLEIVRYDQAGGEFKILANTGVPSYGGGGASILKHDDWIYGIASGIVFKLHEDGTGYQVITKAASGVLFGFDYDGTPLGVDGFRLFRVTSKGCEFFSTDGLLMSHGQLIPIVNPVVDSGGEIYGLQSDGPKGVAQLIRTSSKSGKQVSIAHIGGGTDAAAPVPYLTYARNGGFYGLLINRSPIYHTSLFWMNRNGAEFKLVHRFAAGEGPTFAGNQYKFIQAPDGRLYSSCAAFFTDSPKQKGAVFRINADGTAPGDIIDFFNSPELGTNPLTPLLLNSDGNLYGVNQQGGENGDGTIYRVVIDQTSVVPDLSGTFADAIPDETMSGTLSSMPSATPEVPASVQAPPGPPTVRPSPSPGALFATKDLLGRWLFTKGLYLASDITYLDDGTYVQEVKAYGISACKCSGKWLLQNNIISYEVTAASVPNKRYYSVGDKEDDHLWNVTPGYYICQDVKGGARYTYRRVSSSAGDSQKPNEVAPQMTPETRNKVQESAGSSGNRASILHEEAIADARLNYVFRRLRTSLNSNDWEVLKADELHWIKVRDTYPPHSQLFLDCVEKRIRVLQAWNTHAISTGTENGER